MMTLTGLTSVPADHPAPFTDQLRPAVAAYLARFTGPPAGVVVFPLRVARLAEVRMHRWW
jgi:hypothetical protein